jgi:hypothetical protein
VLRHSGLLAISMACLSSLAMTSGDTMVTVPFAPIPYLASKSRPCTLLILPLAMSSMNCGRSLCSPARIVSRMAAVGEIGSSRGAVYACSGGRSQIIPRPCAGTLSAFSGRTLLSTVVPLFAASSSMPIARGARGSGDSVVSLSGSGVICRVCGVWGHLSGKVTVRRFDRVVLAHV